MAEAIIPFIPKTDSASSIQPETVMLVLDIIYPESTLISMPMTFPYTFNTAISSFFLQFHIEYFVGSYSRIEDYYFDRITYDPLQILSVSGSSSSTIITYQMMSNHSFSIFLKTNQWASPPVGSQQIKIIATALINGQFYFLKNT